MAKSEPRYEEVEVKVMKFGGSSVQDAETIAEVCRIVEAEAAIDRVALIFSAMKGVTDRLIACAESCEKGSASWRAEVDAIDERHRVAAAALLKQPGIDSYENSLHEMQTELRNVLQGIELVRECSPRSLDLVMSFGERLICPLIVRALSGRVGTEYVDARQMIFTDRHFGSAGVNFDRSYEAIRAKLAEGGSTPVIPGFIASSDDGATTTLGRNGSDYTASLIGSALGAESIEIWTDVDGVLSADPRSVPNAFVIPEINYEEAMELAYFGAKVLHPATMIPAFESSIPIRIRNTMNPGAAGTTIRSNAAPHSRSITGIASIRDVSLINVEGGGMLGMPGIASHVFQALADAKINVIMISQASSEHSICIVCRFNEAEDAIAALRAKMGPEVQTSRIHDIALMNDLEVMAIIGENMRGKPGISGRLFSSLGDEKINVLAIAQGSSERNISFVIHRSDHEQALKAVHRAFIE